MVFTGAKRDNSIIELLNSTASDEIQLALAAEILDYRSLKTGPARASSHPRNERILRWLLSKIGQQEPKPGCALIDPETYNLLSLLLAQTPIIGALKQLQYTDLLKSIGRCLRYTQEELAVSSGSIEEVSANAVNGVKSSYDANSEANSTSIQANAFERLKSVFHVFWAIQEMPYSGEDSKYINLHSRLIRNAMKVSFEQAASIIESGLLCILSCIELGIWRVPASLEDRFIVSLVNIWDLVSYSISGLENHIQSASLFAKHCLIPALQLTLKHPTLDLSKFAIEHCLLPLTRYGLDEEGKLSESLSLIFGGIPESLPRVGTHSHTIGAAAIEEADQRRQFTIQEELDPILLGVKLLSMLNEGMKLKSKDILATWYRDMFVILAALLNVNVAAPQRRILSMEESMAMSRLLSTFREAGISPGSSILSNIILYYTNQDPQSFLPSTWKIIKICLQLQHEVVSSFTNESIQIIEHIFSSISSADSRNYRAATVGADDGPQQSALSLLLEPLLNVVVRSRKLSQLLPFWQNYTTKALQEVAKSDPILVKRNPNMSFWESDTVQQVMRTKFIDAMPFNERLALFTKLATNVSRFLPDPEDMAAFYGTIIVLSTIITSFEMTSSQLSHTHQQPPHSQIWELYVAVGRFYISSENHDWKYHLLGLLDELRTLCIQETSPPTIASLDNDLVQLFGVQIRQTLDSKGEQKYYRCASAAWSSLVLRLQNDIFGPEILTTTVRDVFSTMIAFSAGVNEESASNGLADDTRNSFHDDCQFDSEKAADFLRGCISTSLHYPKIYEITRPAELKTFVSSLYFHGRLASRFSDLSSDDRLLSLSSAKSWQNLWNQFICSKVAAEVSSICHAIHQTQINGFIDSTSMLLELPQTNINTKLALHQFSLRQLSSSYFISMSKEDRGKIVNQLVANLCFEALEGDGFLMSLRLLCQLMERPSRLITLVSNPHAIWTLFETLEDKLSVDCVDGLCTIARHLLLYWMAEDKGKDFDFTDFTNLLKKRIRQTDGQPQSISGTIITATAIALFHGSTDKTDLIPQNLQSRFLESQIQYLMNNFPSSAMTTGVGNPKMYAVLGNICVLPVSLIRKYGQHQETTHDELQIQSMSNKDYFEAIQKSFSDTIRNTLSEETDLTTVLCWFRVQDIIARTSDKQGNFRQYLGLELALFPRDIQRRRLKELQDIFKSLPAHEKASSLVSLSSDSVNSSSEELRYLYQLTSIPLPTEEREKDVKVALRRCLEFGLEISTNSKQAGVVAHALKLVYTILDQNPWAVHQYGIDSSLSTIIDLLTERREIAIATAKPSQLIHIFTQSIQIFSTLFQKHRRKIGGRWHSVNAALTGILRCLFEPFPDLRHRETIPQPAWMQEARIGHIQRQHVDQFSRLLTTICDPSHQALRTRQTQQTGSKALNDASKAARSIAGQHMMHFIEELCWLQLRGKMVHRDALNPGVYAIFDAMSTDVCGRLNELLDDQTRVIFKVLYDDWKRFGKWDGK